LIRDSGTIVMYYVVNRQLCSMQLICMYSYPPSQQTSFVW